MRRRASVRALGEQFQERVGFSHDFQSRVPAGQVLLQPGDLLAQPLQLGLLGRLLRPHRRGPPVDQGIQRAGLPGLAPLDDMRVAQPLAPQDRALLPGRGGVVLGNDPQLVLRGKRPPLRLRRQLVTGGGYRGSAGHAEGISCLAHPDCPGKPGVSAETVREGIDVDAWFAENTEHARTCLRAFLNWAMQSRRCRGSLSIPTMKISRRAALSEDERLDALGRLLDRSGDTDASPRRRSHRAPLRPAREPHRPAQRRRRHPRRRHRAATARGAGLTCP
ncbi:hypothetical protein SCOCK_900009 [Actinacidiphila cocklensis]|uniref:Uncharacterized protein n=1 Tax=Actinacidiphila cocklensis TaxID=887465 RepID=A0A9W4DZJ8_9ACTN|nr:hypothetical protein SCOCK_900009 [Actinacidiphila cocklensis]